MRAILCVFSLAVVTGCSGMQPGKGGNAGDGADKKPSGSYSCTFVQQSNGLPDTTSCRVKVTITPKGCKFKPQLIYVATDGVGDDLSKFDGLVRFDVDSPYTINIVFKDATPWKSESPPTGSAYALRLKPGAAEGIYRFQVVVSSGGTEVCTTPDPVIGNGLY
jgi:hypothetical protein